MGISAKIFSAVALMSLAACSSGGVQPLSPASLKIGGPTKAKKKAPTIKTVEHWGYHGESGPEQWGDLSSDYATCKTGDMQSPIDLAKVNAPGEIKVATSYARSKAKAKNKGYTLQVDFGPGQSMFSGGNSYNLAQFHLHTPSEHVFSGASYPMVAHFVHIGADDSLAVLGVMFEEGAPNRALDTLLNTIGHEKEGYLTIDTRDLLPGDLKVFRYMGSLTTPPCSEGVNWHVAHQPITASAEQIHALAELMGVNARPVQPKNGRLLVGPGVSGGFAMSGAVSGGSNPHTNYGMSSDHSMSKEPAHIPPAQKPASVKPASHAPVMHMPVGQPYVAPKLNDHHDGGHH